MVQDVLINDILQLSAVFIPPLMSSTMNSETITQVGNRKKTSSSEGDGQVGRKEKPDNEKSEKTIANKESMS